MKQTSKHLNFYFTNINDVKICMGFFSKVSKTLIKINFHLNIKKKNNKPSDNKCSMIEWSKKFKIFTHL